jgi:hypothetical protein
MLRYPDKMVRELPAPAPSRVTKVADADAVADRRFPVTRRAADHPVARVVVK